ncbi:flap endonuclease [Auraticoccus sp. F435]|uniref:5'-3' exonuclease n=2 Tax=Auraticoccus cholistanensis TaxID=2656650 RepID=A0A6A9UT37_9ACTN|nr:5'-3' exonuclease [Auraticoccus cholistanensis]MVA75851.1 flap endonuclease [Auraticoccus cholistanensis]
MLLDTASLYFRAFYGVPTSVTNDAGQPVNAVRGLLDFIARFVTDYRPTHLACCWDNDWRPQWRVDLLPSYKTHRVAQTVPADQVVGAGGRGALSQVAEESPDELTPQVPVIRDVLAALGIAVVGKDGYEADDVIGTLASTAGVPVDVVTGDRDLFQLVDDRTGVRVLYVARGISRHERVDEAWVRERYAIPAAAYADFAVMRGDTSDGIPGVPGIGEKTAAQLLARHTSLHGILRAASDGDPTVTAGVRSKLAAAIDYLAVAPEVVAVARDLDLGVSLEDLALPTAPVQPERWSELVAAWSLGGSAERIAAALAARG